MTKSQVLGDIFVIHLKQKEEKPAHPLLHGIEVTEKYVAMSKSSIKFWLATSLIHSTEIRHTLKSKYVLLIKWPLVYVLPIYRSLATKSLNSMYMWKRKVVVLEN